MSGNIKRLLVRARLRSSAEPGPTRLPQAMSASATRASVARASEPQVDCRDHVLPLRRGASRLPDAAFIAVQPRCRPIAAALRARGGGGFVCFAAGFSETGTAEGERLTQELIASARRCRSSVPTATASSISLIASRFGLIKLSVRRLPRRRTDLSEWHSCADPDVQRALGADRLHLHGRQPDIACGGGSDRALGKR